MDITDHPSEHIDWLIAANSKFIKWAIQLKMDNSSQNVLLEVPAETSYHEEVKPFIDDLDTSNMKENLEAFTSFHNRYYKSSWGARSCAWLLGRIQEIAEPAGDRVTVEPFHHDKVHTSYISP